MSLNSLEARGHTAEGLGVSAGDPHKADLFYWKAKKNRRRLIILSPFPEIM
jgi:hypothetical protein